MSFAYLNDDEAAVAGTVSVTDDGSMIAPSGAGGPIHNYGTITSTGPVSVILITWSNTGTARTLSSLAWGTDAPTILVQDFEGTDTLGAAIAILNGAKSANLKATFNGDCDASAITIVSLNNLSSLTAIDTDASNSASGAASLAALTTPGVDGVRLCAYANAQSGSTITWANASELTDDQVLGSGANYRHSAGYDSGNDGTAITANSAASTVPEVIVGVSLR